jgi:hypothetical protein
MSFRILCPHCQAGCNLAVDPQGRKVECPRCQQVFTYDAAQQAVTDNDNIKEAIRPEPRRAGITSAPRLTWPESENEDEPPLPVKKRSYRTLVLTIGLMLLLAGSGVGGYLWLNRMGDLVEDSPVWLRPPRIAQQFTPEQIVTLHIVRTEYDATPDQISRKLQALVDPGQPYDVNSMWVGNHATVVMATVKDPDALAAKIDFGKVRRVKDRIITVVARKIEPTRPSANQTAQLLQDLKSREPLPRSRALQKLKDMLPNQHRVEVAAALESLLSDRFGRDRRDSIELLGVWGGSENVPALLIALDDFSVAREVMQALGKLKDERAIDPLVQQLCKGIGPFREEASAALKSIGSGAEKAVAQCLKHQNFVVQREACEILAVIGTEQSIPALKAAAAPTQSVPHDAQKAINAINARK